MTQLIDKEDVLREISTCDDVFVTEAEQEYLWERMQMLPTVDAIPISFIEEQKAWAAENGFGMLYANDLTFLLSVWAERKEE